MTHPDLDDANAWPESDRFPMSHWRDAVEAGDTTLGYADWMAGEYGCENLPIPQDLVDALLTGPVDEPSLNPHTLPEGTLEAWSAEVEAGDTRLGLLQWASHRQDEEWFDTVEVARALDQAISISDTEATPPGRRPRM
jgi:hypothetical protein